LRLENGPSPTLCENCHADKAYIENTDHDLEVTAPHSENILGQSPAEFITVRTRSSSGLRVWAGVAASWNRCVIPAIRRTDRQKIKYL
jgi:hypothetical protein